MASSRKRDFSNDDDEPTEENTPKDGTTTKRQLTLTIYKKRTAVNAQDAQKTATASESLDTEAFITPKNIIKHESTDDEDRAISPSIPTPPLDRSNTHTSEVYLSWNTACPGDRLLVQMRDKGENWNTIHRAWTDLTGERQGNRTLPTRYRRLKANFTALEDAEVRNLQPLNGESKPDYLARKAQLVAEKIMEAGGSRYSLIFIERKLAEVEEANDRAMDEFVDWDGNLAEGEEADDHAMDEFVDWDGNQ